MTETLSRHLLAWVRTFEDDVRAGRLSLLELVESAVADADGLERCPTCSVYPVRPGTSAGNHGLCAVCWLRRLRDAAAERHATLIVQRDYAMEKQRLHRLRESEGLPLPRSRPFGEYGGHRVGPTDDPLRVACSTCGEPFTPRAGADECSACRERRERRAKRRTAAEES